MRRALIAWAALAAAPALGAELEAGASVERLSGGREDWRSAYLEAAHTLSERRALYGGARETERFGLRDTEAWAGHDFPLDARWSLQLEASTSPTHRVLPRLGAFAQLQRRLGDGWMASAGLRYRDYDAGRTNQLTAGAERYWGAWRGAYTLYLGRPDGGSTQAAHRVQLDRYYGARNSAGLSLAGGREAENQGPPAGIVTSDIRAVALVGRHWLDAHWALAYELGWHEQGDFYRRRGLRLGIRRAF